MNSDIVSATKVQLENDLAYLTKLQKDISEKLQDMDGVNDKQKIVALTEAQESINNSIKDNIEKIQEYINNSRTAVSAQSQMLNNVSENITDKQNKILKLNSDIEHKNELMNTRNRMLELSMEKNIYKRKVIYTILALILAVIVLLIAGYVTFNKS